MNICPRCGKFYDPEDKFCGFCGFNLAALMTTERDTQRALKVSDIHFNLGMVYYKMGKFDLAMQTFENCLEKNPDNLRVRNMYKQARKALKSKTESS